MSAVSRKPAGSGGSLAILLPVLAVVALFFFAAFPTGEAWAGRPYSWANPAQTMNRLFGLAKGSVHWSSAHTTAVLLWIVLPLALACVAGLVRLFTRSERHEIDQAAPLMGTGQQIAEIRHRAVAKKAHRLGLRDLPLPGLPLAVSVRGNHQLFASFEDTCVDIWGTRMGKSSTRSVPVIISAPGPVLATSNKPDLVQIAAAVRAERGRVVVIDPQGIMGDSKPPGVWANLLAPISEVEDAKDLAQTFAETTADPDAHEDGFFAPTAKTLVADLLLAAAVDGQYIDAVFSWVNNPTNPEPAQLLARHGFPSLADRVKSNITMTEKTRDGVYAHARKMLSFLDSRSLMGWLTPGPGKKEFIPGKFVGSEADTLFLLSQEGTGSAGPVIAALTKAIFDEAEAAAKLQPSGRLPVPLVAVLDEAANICRIRSLPDKYSHYGSRGILVMTLLQSYEQGAEVWGENGMAKMWSSANVRIYGGGASSVGFLSDLEKLIGDYQYKEPVVSHSRAGRSTSFQHQTDTILSVADLAAVPGHRMVIFASGCRPVLARTQPWYEDKTMARMVKNAVPAEQSDPVKLLVEKEQELITAK